MKLKLLHGAAFAAALGTAALMVVARAATPVGGSNDRPADPIVGVAQRGVPYMNGGIGRDEVERMARAAGAYDLRLSFSEGPRGAYVADVDLRIADPAGKPVLILAHAGPLTDVQLRPGTYRVSARFGAMTRSQTVTVGAQGAQAVHLNFPHDADMS